MKVMEKKMPLTKVQKQILSEIKWAKGAQLAVHQKMTGTRVFRLLDDERRPLKNYRVDVIRRLVSKQYFQLGENGVVSFAQ